MIHFVGAGSGAVDLITIRGAELLKKADVIIYAGSLVNPELLNYAKESCEVFNSAEMTLDEEGIEYDVCPGVSSFCGAAAALKAEYTLPDVSQSVIITRMAGRTPVRDDESIASFAAHGATMVIFLSTGLLKELSKELVKGQYSEDTPAAIVYKATWPDEKVMHCTVGTLYETAKENNITKTALIIVGDVLDSEYSLSRLYADDFSTEFRQAKK